MTKRTSQQKQRVQAEPVKSETSSKNEATSSEATPEVFEEVLQIDDANERSEALAALDLTEGQKDAAVVAARKDFLEGGVENDLVAEQEVAPLSRRAQKLIDDLSARGIYAPYPSDFSKWDDATFERLEKLNK